MQIDELQKSIKKKFNFIFLIKITQKVCVMLSRKLECNFLGYFYQENKTKSFALCFLIMHKKFKNTILLILIYLK